MGGGGEEGEKENGKQIEERVKTHLDLPHALLTVSGEAEILVVTPENRGTGLDSSLGEHVMEVHNLISALVTNDNEHGTMAHSHTILDNGADAGVDLLSHVYFFLFLLLEGCDSSEDREAGQNEYQNNRDY